MKVKIKKLHEDAVIPSYGKPGDAGMDLTAVSVTIDKELGTITYGTGLAIEIPEGHVGLVFPRSSNRKKDLYLTNHVGVIDSGYRGEIMFSFKPDGEYWEVAYEDENFIKGLESGKLFVHETASDKHRDFQLVVHTYGLGERVGQIIILPYPSITFEEAEELSETERGGGGFGSTGK
jgi:dUTP pyrophosphatase